jgi:hypothetical protein
MFTPSSSVYSPCRSFPITTRSRWLGPEFIQYYKRVSQVRTFSTNMQGIQQLRNYSCLTWNQHSTKASKSLKTIQKNSNLYLNLYNLLKLWCNIHTHFPSTGKKGWSSWNIYCNSIPSKTKYIFGLGKWNIYHIISYHIISYHIISYHIKT